MPDRESVIKGLEPIIGCAKQEKWGAWIDTLEDALALLKEQQNQIEQMQFIYGFVYGGQVKEIKELVRCKDCKHQYFVCKSGDVICGHVRHDSEQHNADWFCADGERR